MKRFLATVSLLTAIVVCPCAQAQVGTSPMSLGMSPPALGAGMPSQPTMPTGPASLVDPVGVPLGSTELAVPGLGPAPTSSPGCPTTAVPGSQISLLPFDGGGLGTTAPGSCPLPADSGQSGNQTGTMPGMPAANGGRTGIPLDSTEFMTPGLGPPPGFSPTPPPTSLISPAPQVTPAPTSPPNEDNP